MAMFAQSLGVFCLLSVVTVLLLGVSSPVTANRRFPQHYTMIHWAGRIEKELEKVLQLVTGGQQMKGIYKTKENQFNVERNAPKQLVEKVSGDIARLLNRKRKALERLAREAEYIQMEHSWQDGIRKNDIQYYDSKAESDYMDGDDGVNLLENPSSLSLEFVDDPNFKNKVNYSYTAVQIPTDIYNGCESCTYTYKHTKH